MKLTRQTHIHIQIQRNTTITIRIKRTNREINKITIKEEHTTLNEK